MHEALCRSSGTTLHILHAERRAADHSANIGSRVHWFFDGWCQWRGRSVSHLRGAIRRVRPGPPVITTGTATFKARINHDGTITYKLSYSKLAGTGEVLFADVHFGQQQNTGGILFFLCANVATAPSQGVPPQPQPGPSPGTTVPGTVNVSAPVRRRVLLVRAH